MNIYYLKLNVSPTKENENYNSIEKADVLCCILENKPENAYRKAVFYIEKYDWEITNIEQYPIEVTRDDFIGKDIGLENYTKAQNEGMSFVYVGISRDRKTRKGPIEINSSYEFDISDYYRKIKQSKRKGRCLHYEAGNRCNEYINSHSIQNKGLLAKIAKDGHVYGLSYDFSSLKKNKGKTSYKKRGINNISTFQGFCKAHDNELFESIDNLPLIPTDQQAFLYGYRSLCRELFVKENALNNIKYLIKKGIKQKAINDLFLNLEKGTHFGLKNLQFHKMKYDYSLKNNEFQHIRYALFISNQEPSIVFSGGIFPDYDFIGRQLQNLGDHSSNLELITFCSAPMREGWGFLFAWHESSSNICIDYIRSLATAIYEKKNISDFLFRLVLNCENHAISPKWWESLSDDKKNKITNRISETVDIFVETPSFYLMNGLEGVSDWNFDNVISNF
jgi:hypothetical protein